jgi:putative membrane protein
MSFVMLAFVVIAQAQLSATPRDVGEVSPSTRQFMQDAATGGTTEVELGRMAANKAASEQVRAFAERMVKDHGAANDELVELAKQKGVSLTTQLDPKHQAVVDRLGRLSGPEFDREYMQAMVDDHRADVTKFDHEAKAGRDADVKSFAARTLPTLRRHLDLAQETARGTSSTAGRK